MKKILLQIADFLHQNKWNTENVLNMVYIKLLRQNELCTFLLILKFQDNFQGKLITLKAFNDVDLNYVTDNKIV